MKVIYRSVGLFLLASAGNAMASFNPLDACSSPPSLLSALVNWGQKGTIVNYPVIPVPGGASTGTASCTFLTKGSLINGVPFPAVDGLPRSAMVCGPAIAPSPGTAPPVVFAFHGSGSCGTALAEASQIHIAWPQALVIYPDGIPNEYTSPTSSNYTGWTGPSQYLRPPLLSSTNPYPAPGTTSLPSNYLGTVPGWQWLLGMVPAVAPSTMTSPVVTPGMTSAETLDLDFVDQMINQVASLYSVPAVNLRLFAVGHSMGSAFTGLLYNLSTGLPSPQLNGAHYQNFQSFKAFAFNTVAPDSAFIASGSTSLSLLGSGSTAYTAPYSGQELIRQVVNYSRGPNHNLGGAAGPTDLILGGNGSNAGPAKSMLISLDCYDDHIPYAVSYQSIINARQQLQISSIPNPNLSNANLPNECAQLTSIPNINVTSGSNPGSYPNTTMISDLETGPAGVQLEVILNTEYLYASSTAASGLSLSSPPGFPASGHAWPTPADMVQFQGKTLAPIYSNGLVDNNGNVYSPSASVTANPGTMTPVGLTAQVVQFFQGIP